MDDVSVYGRAFGCPFKYQKASMKCPEQERASLLRPSIYLQKRPEVRHKSDHRFGEADALACVASITETNRIHLVLFGMRKEDAWSLFGRHE
jgi:hypothetical protein